MTAGMRLDVRRVPLLDGLRGVAVAAVFLLHIRPSLFPGGYLGVVLFFTLSGFLITSLLLQEWSDTARIRLRAFYARRALRLMPALVAMVTVTVLANVVIRAATARTYADAGAGLLYLMDLYAPVTHTLGGGYNHTWSLAVEEQFYLIWPAVLVLGLRRRWHLPRIVVGWMSLLTVGTAALLLTHAVALDGLYRLPSTHFAEIGAGILLAFLLRVERDTALQRALTSPRFSALTLAAVSAALFTTPHSAAWMYLGGYTVAGVLFAGFLGSLLLRPQQSTARVLTVRPLLWLGRRSYGFYLWHAPILEILVKHTHRWWVFSVAGLVLSLIATEVSWRLIETPFLRRKRKFERVAIDHEVESARVPAQADRHQVTVASS